MEAGVGGEVVGIHGFGWVVGAYDERPCAGFGEAFRWEDVESEEVSGFGVKDFDEFELPLLDAEEDDFGEVAGAEDGDCIDAVFLEVAAEL